MELRNVTRNSLGSSSSSRNGMDRIHADAEEKMYFPHAHVPILDDELDDEGFEPDGVNNFMRHLGPEELDEL